MSHSVTSFITTLFAAWEEEQLIRRMKAHLLIDDPGSAVAEAEGYFENLPKEQLLESFLYRGFVCDGG